MAFFFLTGSSTGTSIIIPVGKVAINCQVIKCQINCGGRFTNYHVTDRIVYFIACRLIQEFSISCLCLLRIMGPPPVVTGLSPKEGPPGTRVTIRGESLGSRASDLIGTSPQTGVCFVTTQ